MIKSAKTGKEISVVIVNKVGLLADISKVLAERKINIEAIAGYAKDNQKEAEIKFVSENVSSTIEALKRSGYQNAIEKEVIIIELENKSGALKDVTAKLAQENIDIKYIYATACSIGCPAKMVLSTSDDKKALIALKK